MKKYIQILGLVILCFYRAQSADASSFEKNIGVFGELPLSGLDYFTILGLTAKSPPSELKARYRNLSKMYHPDINKGIPDIYFQNISEAYSILKNANKWNKAVENLELPSKPAENSIANINDFIEVVKENGVLNLLKILPAVHTEITKYPVVKRRILKMKIYDHMLLDLSKHNIILMLRKIFTVEKVDPGFGKLLVGLRSGNLGRYYKNNRSVWLGVAKSIVDFSVLENETKKFLIHALTALPPAASEDIAFEMKKYAKSKGKKKVIIQLESVFPGGGVSYCEGLRRSL